MLFNTNFKIISLLSVVIFVTGCVTNPTQESIESVSSIHKFKTKIKSTKVIIGLDPKNDENIHIHYGGSAQSAGIIGLLVESLIANNIDTNVKSREALLTPIRSAAIKFNFGSKLRSEIEKRINGVSWLNVDSVKKTPNFQRYNIDEISKETSQDIALIIDAHYNMSDDFTHMNVSTVVVAYPMSKELLTLAKQDKNTLERPAIYQHKFNSTYRIEGEYKDTQGACQKWSLNSGAMVHRALQTSIKNITNKIILDLEKKSSDYVLSKSAN